MKKIAIVLMMALLVLGCVFAATDSKNSTNNDKFVVKTTIGQIYPVYELVGKNTTASVTSAKAAAAQEINGILSADGDSLSIKVELNHYGVKNNDTETSTKVDIRYKGAVTVTITAGKLENQATNTTGRVEESELPTAGDFTTYDAGVDNFTASSSKTNNKVEITATYENGKKVATGANAVKIADGEFTWDISGLTAGDTYKADVVVTYTIV